MKLLLLLIVFIPFILQSQETPRVGLGVYAGIGLSNYNRNKPGLAFEFGQNTLIALKKKRKFRIEIFFQYTKNTFEGGSGSGYKNPLDTSYSISNYQIDFLDAGLKFHIPVLYRPKYRLFLTPGFVIGSIGNSSYTRAWYRISDNSLIQSGEYGGYISTRLVLGPTVCISQEFRLIENLYLNVTLNGLLQSTVEFEAQGPWSTFSLRTGVLWYIKSKKKEGV